jgi:hypothetical protein
MLRDALLDRTKASRVTVADKSYHLVLEDRKIREHLCFKVCHCSCSCSPLESRSERATVAAPAARRSAFELRHHEVVSGRLTNTALENRE